MRIKQVGNYWIKEANPNASRLSRWWGRGSLRAQAKALEKLGDMAPTHLFRNGRLVTRDVGQYVPGSFWRTWARGSWRLRTPFNDIRRRNIGGTSNLIFDPAKHPIHEALEWGTAGVSAAGGTYLYRELADEE